jgi:hypothetical protein
VFAVERVNERVCLLVCVVCFLPVPVVVLVVFSRIPVVGFIFHPALSRRLLARVCFAAKSEAVLSNDSGSGPLSGVP